ncbi:MAG TPA: hypothetical protein VGD81_04565 [Opitutaceae bacterium]
MNARQTNILNMAHAAAEKLNAIVAANPLPALVANAGALKARLDAIEAAAATQALPITGRTIDRNRILAGAIAATLAVAGRVQSYARSRKLGQLEARCRLRPTTFKETRLAHRVLLMQQVHDAAQEVLPQLADFGVTVETLADLQAKIDAADAVKSVRRLTIIERGVATAKLLEWFRELTGFFDHELDPLVDSLRETNPGGWAAYRAARHVVRQRGASSSEPEATPATATSAAVENLAA